MRGHKGFSLIELLVVVGLIGIVLVIAIPNLRQKRDKGRVIEMLKSQDYIDVEVLIVETEDPQRCGCKEHESGYIIAAEKNGKPMIITVCADNNKQLWIEASLELSK